MPLQANPGFEAALVQASEELGLQSWYRDIVRPLFRLPMHQWPGCCGGGCEPCNQVVVAVALRVHELLGVAPS